MTKNGNYKTAKKNKKKFNKLGAEGLTDAIQMFGKNKHNGHQTFAKNTSVDARQKQPERSKDVRRFEQTSSKFTLPVSIAKVIGNKLSKSLTV